MQSRKTRKVTKLFAASLGAVLLAGTVGTTWADPPDWAPAHGWRKKQDRDDDHRDRDRDRDERRRGDRHHEERRVVRRPAVGPTGTRWPGDYGVIIGNCNRAEIGAVLGATVGGAIGSRVGEGNGRIVATVIGAVVGGVLGAQVGRSMDEEDRACIGHALELTSNGRPVRWENEHNGARYLLTPLGEDTRSGTVCRQFALEVVLDNRTDVSEQRACREDDGRWNMEKR